MKLGSLGQRRHEHIPLHGVVRIDGIETAKMGRG